MPRLDDKTIAAIKGPEPGKTVLRIKEPDVEPPGALWLRVTKRTDKAGVERVSKSWEFYWTKPDGKLGCIGLGGWVAPPENGKRQPPDTRTARQARIEADRLAQRLLTGEQPVGQRQTKAEAVAEQKEAERARKVEAARTKSFKSAVEDYLEKKDAELENERHRQIWRSSLVRYALPIIGEMAVAEITMQDVLRVMNQKVEGEGGATLWECRTESASRLRNRIEAVLSWATVAGFRSGDNPARWTGNLKEMLPAPSKIAKKENQPALAIADLPTWFADLRKREGTGARALEFAVLCCSRSGEVRGATWGEFTGLDGDKPMWVIGKDRTKTGAEYRVPLSPEAVKLLKAQPRMTGNDLVFPAPRGRGELSDMTISKVMKTMHEAKAKADGIGWIDPTSKRPAVPHGTCRSTPRQWFAETGVERDLAEMMLGHKVGSEVERAYQRSDMIERRRALATAWAAFCHGQAPADNVVPLRGAV